MRATINGVVYESLGSYEDFRKDLGVMLRNKGWSFLDSYMLSSIWLQWCVNRKVNECEIVFKNSLRVK